MMKRVSLAASIALLLVFAGCKGESPTAPPPGGGIPPGTTPPPSGVNIVLNVSSADPLVDSTVVVTATVTQDGQPVPNGTAVEFSATNGTFTDTSASTTIRTTTNGVATANLTSATAGPSRITAVVNNVIRTTDITWRTRPVTNPPANTTPTIQSITPSIGRPAGGETIRINGTNFRGPVRVLFDLGGPVPVEGFVVSRTDTVIEVITPAVNVGAGQQLVSRIIVLTEAGTANEQRAELANGFTFRNEQLTPRFSTATPSSGPIQGGTRVSIFGDGFQSPVQVLFGNAATPSWQEAQVVEVKFNEIVILTPPARSTSPNGSGPVTGPVDLRIVNIASQTEVISINAFRYVSKLQITGIRPLIGSAIGDTEVTIDGIGFESPVSVNIAGIEARPQFVSGSRIIVRTGPLSTPCTTAGGAITVRNLENGDSDIFGNSPDEPIFTYQANSPRILTLDVPAGGIVAGQTLTAIVRNPGIGPLGTGEVTFLLGERPVVTSPNRVTNGLGDQTFTLTTPNNLDFPTIACVGPGGEPGTQLGAVLLAATFRNLTTGCFDTIPGAVRVIPNPAANPCVVPPPPDVEQVTPIAPNCANAGSVAVADATGTATITFRNTGGRTLVVTPDPPFTGDHPSDFSIPSDPETIAPGASATFTVTFNPSATGLRRANIRFITNDPDAAEQSIVICVQGNGT